MISVLANWIIPFSFIARFVNLFDRGPDLTATINFSIVCAFSLQLIYIFRDCKTIFYNTYCPAISQPQIRCTTTFIPFMATGTYIEHTFKAGKSINEFVFYALQLCLPGYSFRLSLQGCTQKN